MNRRRCSEISRPTFSWSPALGPLRYLSPWSNRGLTCLAALPRPGHPDHSKFPSQCPKHRPGIAMHKRSIFGKCHLPKTNLVWLECQQFRLLPDPRVSAMNGGRSPSAALLSSPRAGCLPLSIACRAASLRPAFLRDGFGHSHQQRIRFTLRRGDAHVRGARPSGACGFRRPAGTGFPSQTKDVRGAPRPAVS